VDFINQSEDIYAHKTDMDKIGQTSHDLTVNESDFGLIGKVNRQNAQLVVQATHDTSNVPIDRLVELMNVFPGVSRRFERISEGVYSDYAHTPEKIRGALQVALKRQVMILLLSMKAFTTLGRTLLEKS
jgi:UDP-N-acetylmuramate-alanine ligase